MTSLEEQIKNLQGNGFRVSEVEGHLIVTGVPYLDAEKEIAYGALAFPIGGVGQQNAVPANHIALWCGGDPHDLTGEAMDLCCSRNVVLIGGQHFDKQFSRKKREGRNTLNYKNFVEIVQSYFDIIAAPTGLVKSDSTPENHIKFTPEYDWEKYFEYRDVASSKSHITDFVKRLISEKIAIVGLGGSGSYVLDFLSKCPIREIHLFDDDVFDVHNAYRAPSAASKESLSAPQQKKVDYFAEKYGAMKKAIIAHGIRVGGDNVKDSLSSMEFVFLCMDGCPEKKEVVEWLEKEDIDFISVGLGLRVEGEPQVIAGQVETYPRNSSNRHNSLDGTILSYSEGDGVYNNVQVADMNALAAVMAIFQWKSLKGFYPPNHGNELRTFLLSKNGFF